MTRYALVAHFETDMPLKPDLDETAVAHSLVNGVFDPQTGDGIIVSAVLVEPVCECPPEAHDAEDQAEVPQGYRRPLDIRDDLDQALRRELTRHRQEHEFEMGSSKCSCGGWEGPYTMLPNTDERSFAWHLAQALEPYTVAACGEAYSTGYYDGAEEKADDYQMYLEQTSFPSDQPTDPITVALYVQHLERALRTIAPRPPLLPGAGLVFGLVERLAGRLRTLAGVARR